ncbi:MAG: hypothetical protein ACKORJ_00285 [Bacteroidota bacterium]
MRKLIVVFMSAAALIGIAQPVIGPQLSNVQIPFTINGGSVDRLGEFYLTGGGQLMRLDTEGRPASQVRLSDTGSRGLLECWNPLRIWYHDPAHSPNRAAILDHSLAIQQDSVVIDPAIAIKPILIAPAILNSNCWVLDMDYSVKYLNLTTNTLMLETAPLVDPGTDPGFLFIRAYQNLLFLQTRDRGILVMNMTGKVIRTIPTDGATHVGVLGEDIYFKRKNNLIFINLYTGDQSETMLPAEGSIILANDERLLIADGAIVRVFRFTPPR